MSRKDGYQLTTANMRAPLLSKGEYGCWRLDEAATAILERKQNKQAYKKRSTKADRRAWFYSLSDEERETWILKKNEAKRKRLEKTGFASNCTVFPAIDASNRKAWQDKVLRMNPWLDPNVFDRYRGPEAKQARIELI